MKKKHYLAALAYLETLLRTEENLRDLGRLREFPRKHSALWTVWEESYVDGLSDKQYYESWKKLGDYENPVPEPVSELQSLRKRLAKLRTKKAVPNEKEREQMDIITARIYELENTE